MLANLKELLRSKDEDNIKQAIELILSLGMEEELEEEFKDILDDSIEEELKAGETLQEFFMFDVDDEDSWDDIDLWNNEKEKHYNEALAQACLLALLKATGRLGTSVKELTLRPNSYFEEFDLLSDFEGIEHLCLIGFSESKMMEIIENARDLKELVLNDFSSSLVESLKNDDRFLSLLEVGLSSREEIRSSEVIYKVLSIGGVELGKLRERWVNVLRKLNFAVSREANGINFNLIHCPAGEFWMGTDDGGPNEYDDERPRHKVKISKPFLMGQMQVTQALWQAVMGNNPSHFKGDQLPVEKVSWFDSVKFCNKLSELEGLDPAYIIESSDKLEVEWNKGANGYRLPTEAEWEYAAKAGTELIYAGSNNIDEVAWYDDNSEETHPVGQKKANAWGLYDCSGNIYEWCNDQWDSDAYKNRSGTVEDPSVYGSDVASRSIRGGNWGYDAVYCRVADRVNDDPDYCRDLGFRFLRKADA